MIDNYNKCCQNGDQKKEEYLLLNSPNNLKISQIKDSIQKNYAIKSRSTQENLSENETNFNKINILPKNEDKKLDLKDTKKSTNEQYFLNKKRKRISKKILFKHRNIEINLNELTNIIHKIIEEVGEKYKLLINSQANKKYSKNICNYCHRGDLSIESKMINISSPNDFKEFYDNIFNIITNDVYKQKIIKISKLKYNIILENQKEMNNIKINNKEDFFHNKSYCFICIYNSLLNNQGLNLLWKDFFPKEKKIENKTEVEDILINTNINTENIFNVKNNFINNITNKENISNDLNIEENFNLIEKKPNIFDLILGDENDDNNLNDLENLSDDNKSIKNKNNENKKIDKKNKKYKTEKKKENKILFTRTKIDDNNELNKINVNDNINNINKNNFDLNDKKKNINSINMNNLNNLNQFNSQKFLKKNSEQAQPLLFNVNHNPIISSPSNQNIINNSGALEYLNSLNNNSFINDNDESMYNKLNDQLSFLKNKLSLESNLNETRIENLNNMNNEIPILISNVDFKENLLYFKNSMQSILSYMDNINNMLDKYACINEQSLSLIDSMINGNISADDITKLKNNSNSFSDILNYNYNIKKINTDLCDKIINYLNH